MRRDGGEGGGLFWMSLGTARTLECLEVVGLMRSL